MEVMPLLAKLVSPLPAEEKESLKNKLAAYLNGLLLHNFPALIQLLYQVDVPEDKLKAVLKDDPQTDAGALIADLLIKRQQEKAATRNTFRSSTDMTDEERW